MPIIDFDQPGPKSSTTNEIPSNRYLCQVFDVREKFTQNGNEMWSLFLKIQDEGPYFGKLIFDNLVFSPKAINRLKIFFKAIGLEAEGKKEYFAAEIFEKYVYVTGKTESYKNDSGETKNRFKVDFNGYKSIEDADYIPAKEPKESEVPF
jgi:hypothetical protein